MRALLSTYPPEDHERGAIFQLFQTHGRVIDASSGVDENDGSPLERTFTYAADIGSAMFTSKGNCSNVDITAGIPPRDDRLAAQELRRIYWRDMHANLRML
ncbi:MAG: hypothetical protein ABI612_00370 [Betaproteobacteria bacterium]